MKRFETAIVVGASSGIGEAIARRLGADGAHVALLARRETELQRVADAVREAGGEATVVAHDVRDTDAVPELFDRLVEALGGLDLLVYASGAMPSVEEHEYDFAKERLMVEVNLLGAMAWLNPAAAHMEAARRGTLLGISSIAGERGRRGNPGYCTTKAALTTYLESLRNRLSRYGVDVVTVKPGFVETRMLEGMDGHPPGLAPIPADEAAGNALAMARKGPRSGFVPWRWSLVAFIIRHIPSFLFRRTNI
ncbi:MAG: SDR family NAD(P)-dependent oxidoreductase [Myxococcota bacterium]